MSERETIRLEVSGGIARLTLYRPEIHNAFNDVMLSELIETFGALADDPEARVLVLTGEGKSFCAGADLQWMKKMIHYSFEENLADSDRVAECLERLHTLPQPTIARVNGAAIGGGMGLVTACDIAVASESASLGLSEVKIGLVPSVIAPYVLRRASEGRCREYFLTGERLTGRKAAEVGLVQRAVPEERLDEAVDEIVGRLLSSGPEAIASCKELIGRVAGKQPADVRRYTVELIAKLRVSDEGQEGMNAFLEKRKTAWWIEGPKKRDS